MVFSTFGSWFGRLCSCKRPLSEETDHSTNKCLEQCPSPGPVLLGSSKSKQAQKVQIDKTTAVPEDLYKKLVVAGSRARARGQHSLKRCMVKDEPVRQYQQHLVRNAPYG
eukprot:TRINITY_DN49251_c0_g1_i1.p2 TRINITY_DN49251_c0_g1~~TRINITY_DN49251_c0_g1_i1.p2  ORF type:complete len:110 (-),score=20.84 TRINITY_DN49251_c0_g1_i1:114-443(-)